jgi:hypothetical protein
MLEYPFPEKTTNHPIGRVRLLLDKDGDGKFETSLIFADGLLAPSSVMCWKGGVFVSTLGDIWYLKNSRGEPGPANIRQKIYSGFGIGSIDYMQNGLAWGHRP